MAKEKILFNKATEVLVGVWTDENTAPTSADTTSLEYIIADSLSITQADADETTIDNELSDNPILRAYTAGAYEVDLNNASIDAEFLTKVMGWLELGSGDGYVAPESFQTRYIAIQVKFPASGTGKADKYIYLPKVAIAPKLVFESLKTNVAYGTLSGTAMSANIGSLKIGSGASAKQATGAIAQIKAPILSLAA